MTDVSRLKSSRWCVAIIALLAFSSISCEADNADVQDDLDETVVSTADYQVTGTAVVERATPVVPTPSGTPYPTLDIAGEAALPDSLRFLVVDGCLACDGPPRALLEVSAQTAEW